VIVPVRTSGEEGFTLIEMMIAMAIAIAVMGAIFTLVNSAQAAFQAQGDVPDLQQRLRASIDVFTTNVRNAGGIDAPVRPYRIGALRDDFAAGVYYRADTITVFHVSAGALPADAPVVATRTYYLRPDAASDTFDLMQYDGRQTDLPVIDRVATVAFEYFGDPHAPQLIPNNELNGDPITLDPAILVDGPWWEDQSGRFDADLVRVRSIGVRLRVRSVFGSRLVPDLEITFRVALRNLTSGT
jgi:prepilin-type N-terminal cleavage/methylation domain-containing protein